MILEEVQYLVGVLNSGRNTIFSPPFGGLSGELPLVLPFLHIRFKRLVLVQVDCRGISNVLGGEGERDHSVGDGCCNFLNYGHDKSPKYIASDGRSCCDFFSVALISLRHRCYCLLGRSIG